MERRGAPKKVIDKKAIGKRIAQARKQAGLTQEELMELIGRKNVKSISDWERGISTPPKKTLEKIANICGVSFDSIYTANDAQTEESGKIIQQSINILRSFDPIEYHLNVAMRNARSKVNLKNISSADLGRFEAYMEASIKSSMEFFINNLVNIDKKKG